MSLVRIKSPPFGVGEKVTSAQLNGIDQNIENALDKRLGQTDTLSSVVSCNTGTPARVIPTFRSTFDADTTYTISQGISVLFAVGLTATRTYTFSNTGATPGDIVRLYCNSGFPVIVKNAAATTLFQCGDGTHLDDDGYYCELLFLGFWVLSNQPMGSRNHSTTFTASGSWVCPKGVSWVVLEGYGGGGGGAGGAASTTVTSTDAGGGSGGGGARKSVLQVFVSPGTTYTVTIGGGGSGGAPGAAGSDGGDTTFANGGTNLAIFPGAQRGVTNINFNLTGGGLTYAFYQGGSANRNTSLQTAGFTVAAGGGNPYVPYPPGQGGAGGLGDLTILPGAAYLLRGSPGVLSGTGTLGGNAGTNGTSSASYHGGNSGGGGGGGSLEGATASRAGDGGNGGNGSSTPAAGTVGTNGGNAPANSGGGGGGGGGGGNDPTTGHNGGSGGNGAAGLLTVRWIK